MAYANTNELFAAISKELGLDGKFLAFDETGAVVAFQTLAEMANYCSVGA